MENLLTKTFETPVGKMQAVVSGKGLCALEFVKKDRAILLKDRLGRWFEVQSMTTGENKIFDLVETWLSRFFDRDFKNLPKIPLDQRGTDFEKKVWAQMLRLKAGEMISYGEMAKRVASPQAQRAVGNASRRNPIALIVPCHRVIGSNGSLTGYGGGLPQKKWLIEHECPDRL